MTLLPLHPSILPLQGGVNFRDQGGNLAADGRRVKSGLLLRSGTLDELTDQDSGYLTNLLVTHIIDYRDPDEEQSKPDVVWPGAHYKNIPANPKVTSVNANLAKIDSQTLAQFDPSAFMFELYRKLPFNNQAYRYLIEVMQQPQSGGLVQHCAVGKDRTGVGSAIVLFALGANYDTVMADYLLTDLALEPYRQRMLKQLSLKLDQKGIDSFNFVLAARQDFLDTALDEVKKRYVTIDNWLEQEFDLNAAKRAALQEKYLEV